MQLVEDLVKDNESGKAAHVARSIYDRCRDDFWKTIRLDENRNLYKRFEDAGLILRARILIA